MACVERDLKDHPVPISCNGQDCHPPDQAAKSPNLPQTPSGMRHPQLLWAKPLHDTYREKERQKPG